MSKASDLLKACEESYVTNVMVCPECLSWDVILLAPEDDSPAGMSHCNTCGAEWFPADCTYYHNPGEGSDGSFNPNTGGRLKGGL